MGKTTKEKSEIIFEPILNNFIVNIIWRGRTVWSVRGSEKSIPISGPRVQIPSAPDGLE